MKKLSLLMVVLILMISFFANTPPISFADSGTVTVTEDQLNVRTGPGTEYSIIGVTHTGDRYAYLGSANDQAGTVWYKIQYTASTAAYISSDYASYTPPAEPTPIGRIVITAEPRLNVRSGPGTQYAVLGTLEFGTETDYYTLEGGWYKIKYQNAFAYISAEYAREAGDDPVTKIVQGLVVTTAGGLNVRSQPNTSAEVITRLPLGTQLEYYRQLDGWFEVDYQGTVAYISSLFAEIVPPTTPPQIKGAVVTTAGNLNVRSRPSTDSDILTRLPVGTKLNYYREMDEWFEIDYQGRVAYISSLYASIVSEIPPEPLGTIVTLVDNLNIRAQASTSAVIVDRLPIGTELEYYRQFDGWFEVGYQNRVAYVSALPQFTQIVSTTDPTPLPPGVGQVVTVADGLNVRSQPNTSAYILTRLPMGSIVDYYREFDGWFEINYQNQMAYISSLPQFAQIISPAPEVIKQVIVTAEPRLNIRSGPSLNASVVGSLVYQSVVNVYGEVGDWYEIRYQGVAAYIYAPYTELYGDNSNDERPVTAVSTDVFPVANSYKLSVPIIITARGVGPSPEHIVYRFSLKNSVTDETLVTQEYSENDALVWIPEVAGSYSVVIEAKNRLADATQATSSLHLSVENVVGDRYTYTIDYYGQTLDLAVLDQLSVSGRAVTDAGGSWVQATKEQIRAAMDPLAYINFDYQQQRPDLGSLSILTEVHVRPNASTAQTAYGVARTGEVYQVLDIYQNWYQIPYGDKVGWVAGQYVNYDGPGLPEATTYAINDFSLSKVMFQFLDLRHYTGMTSAMLNNTLLNKGILHGQGASFIEASKRASVNEVYLVSHAMLETGNGTSQLANGYWYNPDTDTILPYGSDAQDGYVKVYNMYGIGAYDADPIGGGVRYAYQQGWTSPSLAIIGGAEWIGRSYIHSSTQQQNTLYSMKYNIYDNAHQYATDVGWAVKQTERMYQIYSQSTINSFRYVLPQFRSEDQPY